MDWQLREAKAKFNELVQKATEEGPQTVTRRGKPAVVVVAAIEFEKDGSSELRDAEGAR